MLLLDTHVLIWLAEGLDDLPEASRQLIDRRAAADGLAISAISFWEVAMLDARGRIRLSRPIEQWRHDVLAQRGISEVAVSGDTGIEAVQLPGELHGDPADRILVATARLRQMSLATRDRSLLRYGEAGHVSTIPV